jgi:hypothetical protein
LVHRNSALGVPLSQAPMRSSRLIDGALWSGEAPERFAFQHANHA